MSTLIHIDLVNATGHTLYREYSTATSGLWNAPPPDEISDGDALHLSVTGQGLFQTQVSYSNGSDLAHSISISCSGDGQVAAYADHADVQVSDGEGLCSIQVTFNALPDLNALLAPPDPADETADLPMPEEFSPEDLHRLATLD